MGKRYCEDSDYEIGRSLTTMANLRDLDIAPPDQVIYVPAFVYYVRGDGSRVGDGVSKCDWIWDMLSLHRVATLLDYLDGEDFANVYVRTDMRDGTFPNPRISFETFSAIMWKPLLFGKEGIGVATSPYVMQTVKIQFVNLVSREAYL